MENPRERFSTSLKLRLEELGLTNQSYADRLGKLLIRKGLRRKGTELAITSYVYAVLNQHRTVPRGSEAVWAEVLGWSEGSGEYPEFLAMIEAARAWGKADGRGHVERLELETRSLLARATRAEKALAESERRRDALADQVRALSDRVAMLEVGELKAQRPRH